MKILIAEDDENSRVLLESALAANGFQVKSAENGKIAFEYATQDPPDLVISDILMPEMDGYALCQAIKSNDRLRGIPFVFYTATYTDPGDEKLALDLGAEKFIVKPLEIDLLLNEIKRILEKPEAQRKIAPQKNDREIQRDYSKILAKKLDKKVHELESEKEKLAVSERKYRRLVEALRDNYFFYSLDVSGNFTYLSPSIRKVLGYSQEEYIKSSPALFTESAINKDVVRHIDLGLQGIRQPPYEIEIYDKKGSIHRLEVSEEPLKDSKGRVVGLEGIAHDITRHLEILKEKERLQNQLVQSQKMEAIGTLAGGIAHDFNNILSAIIGYTELARITITGENEISAYLDSVMEAGKRAKELVQQILTFSRQTKDELRPVMVRTIVKEALKLIRASLPTTIDIKQNIRSDALVMGDPTQLHQLIMNLCVNAAHAMRENGGILEVGLDNIEVGSEPGAFQVAELKPGSYLNLTLNDTGEGMSAKVIERIFDPFFTTKNKDEGTGMGLSVVHGIVSSYGGTIRVCSELGKGSRFNIYLPAIEGISQSDTTFEEKLFRGEERILFVDDEPSLVEIGERMLTSLGYHVTSRTSSIDALELFRAKPDHFDLVITDMTMPQMTGAKLASKIIEIRKDIPIILCTGFSYQNDREKPLNKGIRGVLMKPVIRAEMARMVRKTLDKAEA